MSDAPNKTVNEALGESDLIQPDWPAPRNVRALSTTRRGGVSRRPWESLNLGPNCGDEAAHVAENRARLAQWVPAEPLWMDQVHGARVLEHHQHGAKPGAQPGPGPEGADAAVTSTPGQVLAIMTADCLPVLLCDDRGRRIGAAHAGWRGVAGGVIEAAVERMETSPERLLAWLGPAISGAVYEVGEDVREAFATSTTLARTTTEAAFTRHGERWLLDVAGAARIILESLGVGRVYGGDFCTYRDSDRFFSHRRDGVTGRMASLIWMENR